MRRLQDFSSPFIRFAMGGQAVITWHSATVNPQSTLHRLAITEDGSLLVWTMGICGMLMMLDLFVNDWSPNSVKFRKYALSIGWQRMWEHRHWLFIIIAGCWAAQPQVADITGQPISVMLVCYWNTLLNVIAAFIDAGERSRRLWWQRTVS